MRWADDSTGYNHLRAMAQRNAIGVLTLDALDKDGWQQLSEHLNKSPEGVPKNIQTLYLSNILTFLGNDWDPFFRSDANVPASDVRKIVGQVMADPEKGIILENADPKMIWPSYTQIHEMRKSEILTLKR